MTIKATHPQYGGREIKPEQIGNYIGTGWSVDADPKELVAEVAGDRDATAAVLEAERAGKNRKTVIAALAPHDKEA